MVVVGVVGVVGSGVVKKYFVVSGTQEQKPFDAAVDWPALGDSRARKAMARVRRAAVKEMRPRTFYLIICNKEDEQVAPIPTVFTRYL